MPESSSLPQQSDRLNQSDLGSLLHCITETSTLERPDPSTIRKIMRRYVRAGGDLDQFDGLGLPEMTGKQESHD